jgi:hypothetical protein
VKRQGAVTLAHACNPTTFAKKTGFTRCNATVANFSSVAANVDLTVTNLDKGKLDFTHIVAPATAIKKDDGVQWSGTLSPSIPPQIAAVAPADSTQTPAGGYFPIAGFGGTVTVPGADDAITNFGVPTFYFGGETYNQIGVVTDGCVVLGGGNQSDVNYFPQTFPNPARPNNVISPFWTDLNTTSGSGGGKILVNVLTDGDSDWIIVDFEGVKNFSNNTTHTGEVWIRASTKNHVGPAGEQVTISYGAANAAAGDPGSAINWGAENRDGTSGKNLASAPANDSEYAVTTSPPQAGGTATIEYDASSRQPGTYKSVASMTSDVTPGTTQVVKTITVTP